MSVLKQAVSDVRIERVAQMLKQMIDVINQ